MATTIQPASHFLRRASSDFDMLDNEYTSSELATTPLGPNTTPNEPPTITPSYSAYAAYAEMLGDSPVFTLPDNPANMDGLPLDREKNPFYMKSCEGMAPNYPPLTVSFTRAPFPKIVLALKDLTANLHANQIDAIKANPTSYLAIIPFGAGKKFNQDNPMAAVLFTLFIESLGFDLEGLSIADATPATTPKSDFGAPWIYILEGGSEVLRSFLLWQQTFAASSKIAFSVLPFDTSFQSWVIANISCRIISDKADIIHRALGAIKEKLWHNHDFRRITSQCLAEMGLFASPAECAFQATKTFDLHFVLSPPGTNTTAPMWILMGKPISSDHTMHREYLRIIRGATYFVGTHKLEIGKRWLDCVWCKSDTHPTHQCPLPQMGDWLGPRPSRDNRLDMHPTTQGISRGSNRHGTGHGHAGGRGASSWSNRGHSGNRGRK